MFLEDIESKLQEVDERVYYGIVDDNDANKPWNYIVFGRTTLASSDSKKAYTDHFTVAIIRENYIPEGLDTTVIDKMSELDGVRLSSVDGQYTYTRKPNTNIVVELLTLDFIRARKKVMPNAV